MIKKMIEEGYEVFACAPDDEGNIQEKIERIGAYYVPISFKRTGMNPFHDISLILKLVKILKNIKPDIFLSYTIKPNIYGSIAASIAGVKKILAMMTGAGTIFRNDNSRLKKIKGVVKPLYKLAFSKCETVFFLNEDDVELFKEESIVRNQKVVVLGSSGINLNHFTKKEIKNEDTFLFLARLIKDKGIYEFIEAAKIAKNKRPSMKFVIVGSFDSNPTAVTPNQLEEWVEEGIVDYRGATDDVRPYIESSYVVVLPSYHEGQGRVLAEAMAMGRAVITTDVSGCRQTVDHGKAGFLVPKMNSQALANKMMELYDDKSLTKKMAKRGYRRAIEYYDVEKINKKIIEEIKLSV